MQLSADVTLETKVAALSRPESYADRPAAVTAVETHFAWVFLCDRYVYKLKKPARFRSMDLSSLATRRRNCELEVELNKRLAEEVYIAIVPLSLTGTKLIPEADGRIVDWLVKMHRLPRQRMLDRAARDGSVTREDLGAVLDKLRRFYARTPRAAWDAESYRRHLKRQIRNYGDELLSPEHGLDHELIAWILAAQLRFVERNATLLGSRIAEGRVVDAHGDLKPEHVFLAANPQIIDCLEFSPELRCLDTAEELSFLALECERLGALHTASQLLDLYRKICADPCPSTLMCFYRSQRALVRAVLAAWRLDEDHASARYWRSRAQWYLEAARASLSDREPRAVRAP